MAKKPVMIQSAADPFTILASIDADVQVERSYLEEGLITPSEFLAKAINIMAERFGEVKNAELG